LPDLGLVLGGYRVVRLHREHAAEVQSLYERCSDYHELQEGTPTRPTAGVDELSALPPGKDLADKYAVGIYSDAGELIGYCDLIRDFPRPGEWWLGLLMLAPQERASGLGSRIYQRAARWAAARGAHAIGLGVLEANQQAQRFWAKQGFEEVRREPYTSDSGHQSRVLIMRHRLTAT
jgi:GNAT superfamily N-acetyltransferase